jgi:hypothetical protein
MKQAGMQKETLDISWMTTKLLSFPEEKCDLSFGSILVDYEEKPLRV